jgi:hypothetical protein
MKVAGFKIVETTSFVSLLVPLMYVSRSQKRDSRTEFNPSDELALNPVLNFILYTVMKLELGLIKLGIRFSIGGSRLVIGKKQ